MLQCLAPSVRRGLVTVGFGHVSLCSVLGAHGAPVLGAQWLLRSGDCWFWRLCTVLSAHDAPVLGVQC